jgi:hypothetical protein
MINIFLIGFIIILFFFVFIVSHPYPPLPFFPPLLDGRKPAPKPLCLQQTKQALFCTEQGLSEREAYAYFGY